MIYTIGYQNISIEDLHRIMEEKDINILVDVRSRPYSRNPMKYEFNKNRLTERLGNLKYHWMGDTCGGIPGPAQAGCIRWLLEQKGNLLLLCYEKHPLDCHRYYDIGKRLFDPGRLDSVHLFDGTEAKTSELIEIERQKKGTLL